MKRLLITSIFILPLLGENLQDRDLIVKITEDIPYITTINSGKKIIVERIQDTNNRLTDDYTKTSRPCPPFCIQPTKVADGVKNIGELELLSFMQNEVPKGRGVVIDARLKSWFEIETIPSAINIPFTVIQNASKGKVKKIFQLLGMRIKANGNWDFSKAKTLAVFDNGMWCEQSKHFIDGMIAHGYPKEKISYYRDGFQGWKLLGLTTVVHKEIKK